MAGITGFAQDSSLEGGVSCELVSEMHLGGSKKAHEISFVRANSLRTLTGNFLRPCRELNRAIREVSAEIRESA
jgi:hypothetical protein